MRIRSILSEAMRNIASGTAHAFMMFLTVALAGTLFGGYEAVSVLGLEDEAVARITADADVTTIMGGVVDGTACDRLTDATGGPSASGAMRNGPQITPLSTPRSDIASYEVTSGMLRLLAAGNVASTSTASASASSGTGSSAGSSTTVDPTGVWVSSDLAKDFGLSRGSRLETDHGDTTVAGVFSWPNDGRDTRFAYALITPVSSSDGTFDECWAKQWPASDSLESLLYSTTVVSGSERGTAGTTSLNKAFDSRYDANGSYLSRMTRWMPFLGLAVGLLIGVVSVWRRRLEYAGALHSGQTKGAQLFGIAVETFVWAGLGTVVSCALLAVPSVRYAASGGAEVLLAAARTPLAVLGGVIVAAVLAGACVRESQLFRIFKSR